MGFERIAGIGSISGRPKANRGTSSLITRMISILELANKYRLASEMLLEYPEIAIEHRNIMAKFTQQLTNEDMQMGSVLMGEFLFGAAFAETTHLFPLRRSIKIYTTPIRKKPWRSMP